MADGMIICLVCLRTDRKLITYDSKMADFHKELCDYYYSVGVSDPTFCFECGHLLKKFHKFKEKCVMATDILQKWKTEVDLNVPLNQLHTLLRQGSLGAWSANNTKMFYFKDETDPKSSKSTFNNGPVLSLAELGLQLDVPWMIPNVEIKPEKMVEANVLRPPSRNEPITDLISENDLNLPKGIKLETTSGDDAQNLNLDDVFEIKDEIVGLEAEHKSSSEVGFGLESNANFQELESRDDTALSFDKDINTGSTVNSNDIPHHHTDATTHNETVFITDNATQCINNDDENYFMCDDETETDEEDIIRFPELDDINENSAKVNKIIADLENINVELDSINNNYESTMQKGNIMPEKKKRSISKATKNKQNIGSILKNINFNFDVIQENCENIIHDSGEIIDILTKALKENLKIKFANCKELKSQSGVLIDKEHILNCLDGKVTEYLAKLLWRTVKDETGLTHKALKILGMIQERYQNSKYESVFEIEYTNTMEAKKNEYQKRKTYECYVNAKYRCEYCYMKFLYKGLLEKHMKLHDESAGNFICAICGVRYKTKRKHKHHSLKLHEAVYKCKLCPMVTYYRANMKNHYDQHKGRKYKCEPCDKIFSSYSAYKTHSGYEHRRSHMCTVCGRTFETEDILNAHKKTHLRRQPPTDGSTSVKCDECKLSFPSQQVYERHIRFTHGTWYWGPYNKPTIKPPRKQRIWPLRTEKKQRKGYKKHVYTCPVCKATGSAYGWLVSHGRLEHKQDLSVLYANKRKYLCDYCGKGFSNKYTLRDHLNIHTGERPFACDKCPKRFHSSMKLYCHQQYHSPPTFVCEQCGKKFHTHPNLYNHVQAHIGIRRHECGSCGKRFVSAGSLNEHIRGVHMNVRRVRKRRVSDAGVAETPAASGVKRQKALRATSTEESSDSD